MPLLSANGYIDIFGLQNTLEAENFMARRALVTPFRHKVDRDEIDMTKHALQQIRKLLGMFRLVVFTPISAYSKLMRLPVLAI